MKIVGERDTRVRSPHLSRFSDRAQSAQERRSRKRGNVSKKAKAPFFDKLQRGVRPRLLYSGKANRGCFFIFSCTSALNRITLLLCQKTTPAGGKKAAKAGGYVEIAQRLRDDVGRCVFKEIAACG